MSTYEVIKNNFIHYYNKGLENLKKCKMELEKAKQDNNYRLIEFNQRRINDLLLKIKKYETHIEFMRENDETDLIERNEILKSFSETIKKIIPDDTAVVFHGNNNIGIVREIIKTGGLFTPDQRGVSEQSFATQIDVAYKNNIIVSCEFAEPGINSYMPYGAIFVFVPLESEYEKVINTGESTEVFGGVDGVDFRKNPERLMAIITTNENKDRVIAWCLEYGWDSNKVYTHDEYIKSCKDKYSNINGIEEQRRIR